MMSVIMRIERFIAHSPYWTLSLLKTNSGPKRHQSREGSKQVAYHYGQPETPLMGGSICLYLQRAPSPFFHPGGPAGRGRTQRSHTLARSKRGAASFTARRIGARGRR